MQGSLPRPLFLFREKGMKETCMASPRKTRQRHPRASLARELVFFQVQVFFSEKTPTHRNLGPLPLPPFISLVFSSFVDLSSANMVSSSGAGLLWHRAYPVPQ